MIALPNIFTWIERSKTAELVPVLKELSDRMEACYYKNGSFTGCTVPTTPTTHFSPIILSVPTATTYQIMAGRNNVDTGASQSVITFNCFGSGMPSAMSVYGGLVAVCYDATTGQRTMMGGGIYQGQF